MSHLIHFFRDDESGAVTVDWVVLTAAVMAMGIAVIGAIANGSTGMAGSVGVQLGSAVVPDVTFD